MKKFSKLLAAFAVSGMFSGVYAAGTLSGTTVSNQATLSFGDDVETAQTVTSNTVSFVVDNKVDMVVSTLDESAVQTASGKTGAAMKFKVKNEGNTVQDFILTALKTSTTITLGSETLTDNFDATNVQVFVDNGDGEFDAATDTKTYIDELAPDTEAIVYIVADMPAEQLNGDVAIYDLQAQVAEGGASGTQGAVIATDDRDAVDNPLTVEIVFAEDAGSVTGDVAQNGKFLSTDAFKIVIADMEISKQTVVISDTLASANPKRIPGAVVRHCFTVSNNGGAAVTIANISEDIDESKYDVSLLNNNNIKIYTGTGFDCTTAHTLTADTNTGSVNNATGAISIVLNGVLAGETKYAYYDATLK